MKNSDSVQSLVESDKLYQLVTQRLSLVEDKSETPISFESDLMAFILELYSGVETSLEEEKLSKFSIPQVLHYLKASHKLYISKTLPEIEQSMAHIQKRNYDTSEILNALVLFFNDYKVRFLDHIRMEEKDFFPYIKKLIEAYSGSMSPQELNNLLNNTSINQFIDDHDAIEDELKTVSLIIHSYAEEEKVPLPFKVFLNQVELFEMDLRKHAIIEDYVLVPMVQKIEKELRSR